MFNFFKKKSEATAPPKADNLYNFTWHDPGPHNPFGIRVLDIRSYTQNQVSFSSDQQTAKCFVQTRTSIGQELIGIELPGSQYLVTDLIYPHNGAQIEGSGYKAKSMEDKWDIYAWDNIMYFTRSWTQQVAYKAHFEVGADYFKITKVEYIPNEHTMLDETLVANDIHYLIKSHAFGIVYPHKIPKSLVSHQEIALYSFSCFGHNCWHATYDDILDITITSSNQ